MDQENNKQEDTPSSEQNPMLMVKTEKEFWDGAAQTMMLDLFIDDFFEKKK